MAANNLTAHARIRIRSTPEKAFAAFVDAGQMSRFWFTRDDDGLKAGETSTWSLGTGPDAFSFEVRVIDVTPFERIVIEWPADDSRFRQVEWQFEATNTGETIVSIEESGFTGDADTMVAQVLDSQGGFNQVIVAAKAWIEHGVAINVVSDHA